MLNKIHFYSLLNQQNCAKESKQARLLKRERTVCFKIKNKIKSEAQNIPLISIAQTNQIWVGNPKNPSHPKNRFTSLV